MANPMTPPRCPSRVVATVIPAAAHGENSAARRLTPPARTGRPAGSDPVVNTRRTSRPLTLLRPISAVPQNVQQHYRQRAGARVGKRRFGQAAA